jgi:hypothetical protein
MLMILMLRYTLSVPRSGSKRGFQHKKWKPEKTLSLLNRAVEQKNRHGKQKFL